MDLDHTTISIGRATKRILRFLSADARQARSTGKSGKGLPKLHQKCVFSSEGKAYVIYESENIWLSALRLYRLQEGFYYIEALETHPQYRRKGYDARLLVGLVDVLKEQGSFRLCDCVGKKNFASLSVHKRCGFEITDEVGHDYLNDETDDRCYSLQYVYQCSKELY